MFEIAIALVATFVLFVVAYSIGRARGFDQALDCIDKVFDKAPQACANKSIEALTPEALSATVRATTQMIRRAVESGDFDMHEKAAPKLTDGEP